MTRRCAGNDECWFEFDGRHDWRANKRLAGSPLSVQRSERTGLKLFQCDVCRNLLHFETTSCSRCGSHVGYDPASNALLSVEPTSHGWLSVTKAGRIFRFCCNAEHEACNWLFEADDRQNQFCIACRHNRLIPNLSNPAHLQQWRV